MRILSILTWRGYLDPLFLFKIGCTHIGFHWVQLGDSWVNLVMFLIEFLLRERLTIVDSM